MDWCFGFMLYQPHWVIQCQTQFIHIYDWTLRKWHSRTILNFSDLQPNNQLQFSFIPRTPQSAGKNILTASLQRSKTSPHTSSVLIMTWNSIWWWSSSPRALCNVEYLLIAISSRSKVPVRVLAMGPIELFNHLTVSKQMTYVTLNC